MGELKNRVALVTGGSRGIRRAIASRFAAEGAAVVFSASRIGEHARRQGTLEDAVAEIDDAGGQAASVVAHRDPGVQNWIDTTGLPKGYLSHRWAYSEMPDKADWPTITGRVISFDEIQEVFSDDQPRVSPEERREAIRIRQRHVQKRFRVF